MLLGYLGPKGTFTEQACIHYDPKCERLPYTTVNDALLAVEEGKIDRCVAPIENSIEGPVNATIDAMIFDRRLFIEQMIIMPITQNIMVKPGVAGKRIQRIISHPQALAQCRKFISEHFDGVEQAAVSSTAEAARLVCESDGTLAAIGPEIAAGLYGLDILYGGAQDSGNNRTSFIAVTKEDTSGAVEGYVSTLAFSIENKPGELYKVLDIFSLWDINMIKIISRPMIGKPGEYIFLADIENSNKGDVVDALKMVRRKTNFFKVLGTYPVRNLT